MKDTESTRKVYNHSVYILHFDRPYWKNCQHYVGYSKDLETRLHNHLHNKGSKLVKYANEHDIKWQVVAVEVFLDQSSARKREIEIKRNGGGKKLCPICKIIM